MSTSGFMHNRYYEADREVYKLSHSDFSNECDFDDMSSNENLVNFLLEKSEWEKLFIRKKSGSVDIDISSANTIFFTCYKKFKDESDAVDIFSILTDFYGIRPDRFFWKLVRRCRMVLIRDLNARMDIDVDFLLKSKLNIAGQSSFQTKMKDNKL